MPWPEPGERRYAPAPKKRFYPQGPGPSRRGTVPALDDPKKCRVCPANFEVLSATSLPGFFPAYGTICRNRERRLNSAFPEYEEYTIKPSTVGKDDSDPVAGEVVAHRGHDHQVLRRCALVIFFAIAEVLSCCHRGASLAKER